MTDAPEVEAAISRSAVDVEVFYDSDNPLAPWTGQVRLPNMTSEVNAPSFKEAWRAAYDLARPALEPEHTLFGSRPPLVLKEPEAGQQTGGFIVGHDHLSMPRVGDLVELTGMPGVGAVVENAYTDPIFEHMVTVDWGDPAPEKHVYAPGMLRKVTSHIPIDERPGFDKLNEEDRFGG